MAKFLDKILSKEKKQPPIKREVNPEKKDQPVRLESIKNIKKTGTQNKERLARVFDILTEPHITEKATDLIGYNKYVFKIKKTVNKIEIKKAIEDFYGVHVTQVNIIHIPGKKRRLGRSEGFKEGLKHGFKKAIVTLARGDEIEVMPR